MTSSKTLALVAVVLFALIASLVYFLVFGFQPALNVTPQQTFKTTVLSNKPSLYDQFIKNPDVIYSSIGWLSSIPENLAVSQIVINGSSDWSGNGFVSFGASTLGNRTGVTIIHPINTAVGRYIEQTTSLVAGANYVLNLGVTDAADMLQNYGSGGFTGSCADAGIRVIITDNTNSKSYTVFDQIVRNGKWYDYSVDLGNVFSGDKITVRVQSYAADGGCGLWNGEWASVDYVDIVKA